MKEKKVKEKKVKENKNTIIKNREKLTAKNFKKISGPSVDSYNEMVKTDYAKIIERAHQLLSIDQHEYSAPIMITVPDAFYHGGKVNYRLDKKMDNSYTLIYDQALVYVLFFGDQSLFYFQTNINHINGQIASDIAGEFNYSDVIHIETELKYDNNDKPKYLTLDLEIGLVNGTIIPFHLRNHRIHQDYNLSSFLTNQEQQILNILKKKVRDSHSD